jgi:exopolyphosphatase/guanosine-5'-triphosphate,3'-diphosphate pyrophosphatase
VLLLTVSVGSPGEVLDEALATTRLGAGLRDGGRLDPAARSRTRDAVVSFAERARRAGAASIWAFGTAAFRAAADGAAFALEVEAAARVPLEVLSGAREARLAYRAACRTLGAGNPLLVADVGGRTTELTLGVGDGIEASVSLPLGALGLSETHGLAQPASPAMLEPVAVAVDAALASTDVLARARASRASLVASGGTATALAALDLGLGRYDGHRVHGHALAAAHLRTGLAAVTAADVLEPGRAAILPAGAVILERVAAAVGVTHVRVSAHGVRHAYLAERVAGVLPAADVSGLWS